MYEIKDKNGNMLARSKYFDVVRAECDKLVEKGNELTIVEVRTIRTEHTIYKPLPPKWN